MAVSSAAWGSVLAVGLALWLVVGAVGAVGAGLLLHPARTLALRVRAIRVGVRCFMVVAFWWGVGWCGLGG